MCGWWAWWVSGSTAGRLWLAEVGCDLSGDEGGVVADAVDEVGVTAVLEALADDVEAVHRRDAAALGDLAGAVEDGQAQPRRGPPVAGGPDDGGDAVAAQIEDA